jgi:hypothetical protein
MWKCPKIPRLKRMPLSHGMRAVSCPSLMKRPSRRGLNYFSSSNRCQKKKWITLYRKNLKMLVEI